MEPATCHKVSVFKHHNFRMSILASFSFSFLSLVSDDSALGCWVSIQRNMHKGTVKTMGRLLPERETRLQALVDKGMLFWEYPENELWDDKFAMLMKYGEDHGTCNVPQSEKMSKYFLQRIIFVLDIFTSFFPFIVHFAILLCYSSGFSSLFFSSLSGDSALGGWLNTQRNMHKGTSKTKRRLLPEREARLQALVDKGMLYWNKR